MILLGEFIGLALEFLLHLALYLQLEIVEVLLVELLVLE
jgi:hypothetical protein